MSLLTSDYIAGWYFLQKKANVFLSENQLTQPYYVIESLSHSRSVASAKKDAIQGDAGTHIIDQTGVTYKTSVKSNALIFKPIETATVEYKDIFDLLMEDYYALLKYYFIPITDVNNYGANFNDLIINRGNAVFVQNLLESATITIGQDIDVDLEYVCKYNSKFNIDLNDYSQNTQPEFDFIARVARNYDCRFYIDQDNQYYIKSGTITINFENHSVYLANTFDEVPFYSPQGYHVSGSITLLSNNIDLQSIPTEANISLLVDDRYLELGQASIKSSYTRSLNAGETASTIVIQFNGYARLGAGIDLATWITYLKNKLDEDKFKKVLYKLSNLLS